MNTPPRDRAAVVAGHLGHSGGGGPPAPLNVQLAAAAIDPSAPADPAELEYAVALPEHLDAPGPWPVRR